jgi:hypothetical protein
MRSSWPIVLGIFGIVVAAYWYDATNASANASQQAPSSAEAR